MSDLLDEYDDDDRPEINEAAPILDHILLLDQINACLEHRMSQEKLAKWAVDHFYKIEMGEERPEPAYQDAIFEVLDDLMFSDEPGFALDAPSLRLLAAKPGAV